MTEGSKSVASDRFGWGFDRLSPWVHRRAHRRSLRIGRRSQRSHRRRVRRPDATKIIFSQRRIFLRRITLRKQNG